MFAASQQNISDADLLEDIGDGLITPDGRTKNAALEAARRNGRETIEQILSSAGATLVPF